MERKPGETLIGDVFWTVYRTQKASIGGMDWWGNDGTRRESDIIKEKLETRKTDLISECDQKLYRCHFDAKSLTFASTPSFDSP